MTVKYNGKEYYTEKEQGFTSCDGCWFNNKDTEGYDFCACKNPEMTQECYNQQIVWKEVSAPMLKKTKDEEPKFTVEQILAATGKYCDEKGPVFISFNETVPTAVAWIKQYLTQQQDPDYLLYLQLKAKYDQV